MFNFRLIGNILGLLLIIYGMLMLTSLSASLLLDCTATSSILWSSGITCFTGLLLWFTTRNSSSEISKREGYIIVTLCWFAMGAFGALPFLISGVTTSFTDAFFESISGLTTTGSTIFTDLKEIPAGILFWRSMTQWVGGMGIILLSLAILPLLGIGGMQLFVAEVPGVSPDKIHPRVKEMAKRLWGVYVLLTGTETLLLWLAGMTPFEAINHAMTTMATGGFSTENASIAAFGPAIQYIITGFMFLAGVSFSLHYFFLNGKFKKMFGNDELKFYATGSLLIGLGVGLMLFILGDTQLEESFRNGLFMVVSVVTTTGYVTFDYTALTHGLTFLFLLLMFVGGCSGSTAGGIKVVRITILIKNTFLELKRMVHPSAIIAVRLNSQSVPEKIILAVVAFAIYYFTIFVTSTLIMTFVGLDILSAVGAVASSLGNIGPGIGMVGPMETFAEIPTAGKWILSILMIIGRLEIFTVLILFSRSFWRK
ncbi:MAG: TrkH family potassium uptake protein [Flavobacteriales bacterium]|nr:TrkH family potassium uptake protein [Flavobacteriales bacterium]